MIEKIVMFDSPGAAAYMTGISGWVSNDGRFFGDNEDAARYAGCTHVLCSACTAPTRKWFQLCGACRDDAAIKRYNQRPRAKWDGKVPLYSEELEEYFFDMCAVQERLDDLEECLSIEDLRLRICEPVYATPLEADHFEDCLPDGEDLPDFIRDAIEEFNKAVHGIILSWEPGKYAMEAEK